MEHRHYWLRVYVAALKRIVVKCGFHCGAIKQAV